MKRAALRLLFWVYVPLAVLSILVIPLGALGLVKNDPFMTVLALVLGLPWSVLITWLLDTSSVVLNVMLLVVALAINAALLRFAARRRAIDDDGFDEDDPEEDDEDDL